MSRDREVRRLMERLKPHFAKFQRENLCMIEAIYFVVEKTWVENGEVKYNQRIDVKLGNIEVPNEGKE